MGPEVVTLSKPHSAAFVDLNKDCRADVFLTTVDTQGTVFFEVWLNQDSNWYCRAYKIEAPQGAGQVAFVDVNRDGLEDLVFPIYNDSEDVNDEINIVFNYIEVSDSCSYKTVKQEQIFDMGDRSYIQLEAPGKFNRGTDDFPNTLRFGDLNLDGFPDMLVNVRGNSTTYFQVYKNTGKTFKKWEDTEFDKIEEVKDAYLGAFFDLDEDGIIDIMLVSKEEGEDVISSFYNNFLSDAFHLKALALNGHGKQDYSSAYPGAVFMFTLTKLDMTKIQVHTTQSPLTAYTALNTPYCVYGLGRTNSYIEEFYVAMPYPDNNDRVWTPIIPNSYLIASPDTKGDWFLELFASPTDHLGVIIATSIALLVLLGFVIVLMYFKERKQDRQRAAVGYI